MTMRILLFISIVLVLACQSEKKADPRDNLTYAPDNDSLVLPAGFSALVVVDSLGRGRRVAVRENGDVFVHLANADSDGNSIKVLRDTTGNGQADVVKAFAPHQGTGLKLQGDHVYFATKSKVMRMALGNEMVPTGPVDTIVHLEGSEGGHSEKTFDLDDSGNLYVNVGSLSNACMLEMRTKLSPGDDPCVELEKRAGIWKFSADQLEQKQELKDRYATGIRNAVALHWNHFSNSLYCLSHGRDDLHRFWPEKFEAGENVELPSEEFFHIEEGDDFGWPYCYHNPLDNQKYLNPEYGGDGKTVDRCAETKMPLVGFPAHYAPNDLLFYSGKQFPEKYKEGAFIAFHGSWNRLGVSQDGFNVVFQPMKDGKPNGDWEVFADNFGGADFIRAPGDAKYRPCGLTEGPDGSLYVVDSRKGRVWRILHTS